MKSIPSYFYVVNNFTISASQSKYRLFSISFTVTIIIILLFVSQIGLAQFLYADAKKLFIVDKDELTKIIELNRNPLFIGSAYKEGPLK
jgi:hypothetical protein